jgi:hypothetical protein
VAGAGRDSTTPQAENAAMAESRAIQVRSGPWDLARITDYLLTAEIPLRLASQGAAHPLVQSLWFAYDDSALWSCTRDDSVLVRRIQRDGRCGFEISTDSPPYRGVRGTATARLVPGGAATLLPRLIDRYGQAGTPLSDWLLSRLDQEVAIRLGDLTVTSWDYTSRMTPE